MMLHIETVLTGRHVRVSNRAVDGSTMGGVVLGTFVFANPDPKLWFVVVIGANICVRPSTEVCLDLEAP